MSKVNERVFVALDNMTKEEIFTFLDSANGRIKNIKIGLELFNKYGPQIVNELCERYPTKIFLDIKLHDIPNTVSKAILSLAGLPIDYLTIHISGGQKMLEEALKARDEAIPNCKLLGVSILTSLDQEDLKLIWGVDDINKSFIRLFEIAHQSKIDGVICSANELKALRSFDNSLIAVCPGIRFEDEISSGDISDQKRVLSPQKAIKEGVDFLVIGRSLTKASSLKDRLDQLENMPNK
ncbi:orotidine-5'-phosphate decarboxylase [Halobacteriovorax sp. HLS]|uniref:orotidine-5'-phosphate decarboxylase n=1 Tax=Halobacteriovorax sp. HLS TaxID=2234000 RepID=UPI000FD9EC2F|nr:orotidine-5'-phosphate decarboxylase [Halobacteriovorax sp. HLS]